MRISSYNSKRGFEGTIYLSLNNPSGGGGGRCFVIYELRTEIYIHSSDPNTPGNLDKFRGKMQICKDSSNATKEPERGTQGFVAYEIPSLIYIYPIHPNTNANLDTFTKK